MRLATILGLLLSTTVDADFRCECGTISLLRAQSAFVPAPRIQLSSLAIAAALAPVPPQPSVPTTQP